jgi:hypothetical protein
VSLKSTFLKGPQSASRLVPADLDTTGATRAGDLGDTEDPFKVGRFWGVKDRFEAESNNSFLFSKAT